MEEIKIDDYVRTAHGKIDKVAEIIPSKFHTKYYGKEIAKGLNETIGTETDIVKHSKNIKDLVEAGDIVVYKIRGFKNIVNTSTVKEYIDNRTLKSKLRVTWYSLEQINILKILTKEKFESECFEVKEGQDV